jgi:hypothetical protein
MMLTSIGIRLPPMLDPAADAANRAAGLRLAPSSGERVPRLEPNPGVRLDAVSGVVVLEFRNLSGDVLGTVPTARQIAAYRATVLSGAPLPPGVGAPATSRAEGDAPPDQPKQALGT